jgi:hypothetical protein
MAPGLQKILAAACRAEGLPDPVFEHRVTPARRFRFDAAWPDQHVALEVNGGVFTRGRHTRGAGYVRDMEKMNLSQSLGWQVYQCEPRGIQDGSALQWVKAAILRRTGEDAA